MWYVLPSISTSANRESMNYGVVNRVAHSIGDDLLYKNSERVKIETEITMEPKDTNAERENTIKVKTGVIRSGANENIIQLGKIRHINNGRSILWVPSMRKYGTINIDESNNLMVDNSEDSNSQRKDLPGDIEKELKRIATTNISNNIWPMEIKDFREKLITYIRSERKRTAIESYKLKSLNGSEMIILRKEAANRIGNILWRIMAIELVSKNKGATTSGVDNKKFMPVMGKATDNEKAKSNLNKRRLKLINDLSIAKGRVDQAIRRKGINNLSQREKERLLWKENKDLRKSYREELKRIEDNPLKEVRNRIEESNLNNISLKLECEAELRKLARRSERAKYQAEAIKRVYITKEDGNKRPLGIPTIRDRSIQMLWKLVLEPIMEPWGDNTSFGFRPGRNCHQAVCYLANRLKYYRREGLDRMRMKVWLKDKSKNTNERLVERYWPIQGILDCDIKGCFDNIDHNWLINNVPVPIGYEEMFSKILKASINEDGNIQENNKGVPQGGILSPLLMNWTLDGLEERIKGLVKETRTESHPWKGWFTIPGKPEFVKNSGRLETLRNKWDIERRTGSRATAWMVRYADDIIIGTNSMEFLKPIKESLIDFLKERGLELSEKKTREIEWKIGNKLDFLSWTFHLVKPVKVNWIIKAPKVAIGRKSDWLGLYVYPSRKATQNLRNTVKSITSISNIYKTVGVVVNELTLYLRGWSEYFRPGGKQTKLRVGLDNYIYKKVKQFLWKKYQRVSMLKLVDWHLKYNGKWIGLHVKDSAGRVVREVPKLWKLAAEASWMSMEVSKDLLKNSSLVNEIPYMKRELLIGKLKGRVKEDKITKQKNVCPICKGKLVDWQLAMAEPELFKLTRGLSADKTAIMVKELQEREYQNEHSIDWEGKWSNGLEMDHIIPKALGLTQKLKDILELSENKQLVHKDCHKTKYSKDKELIKVIKKEIKDLNTENAAKVVLMKWELVLKERNKKIWGKIKRHLRT